MSAGVDRVHLERGVQKLVATGAKLDPAVKAEWLAALRSGEFLQTAGVLRDATGYCCLGVLCELSRRRGVGDWTPVPEDPVLWRFAADGDDVGLALLPWTVERASAQPGVGSPWSPVLADLNDNGATFDQIADVIEEAL